MFRTLHREDLASLALRWALAAIFISTGLAKLNAGWGTNWDLQPVHFTAALQCVIAWCEFLAGIALLLGLLTRLAAFSLLVIMVGSIWWFNFHPQFTAHTVNRTQELFSTAPVLWQYSYGVAGMCLALLALGGGLFSVDWVLWHHFGHRAQENRDGTVVTTPSAHPRTWTFRRVFYVFRPRGHEGMAG